MKEGKEITFTETNDLTSIHMEPEQVPQPRSMKRGKADSSMFCESDNESGKRCLIPCKDKTRTRSI